mgnify:CR=1 FL=1
MANSGRAAARNKPALVIKSGTAAEGAKAAATHTGALAGSDRVYDAAFRRTGLLRVHDMEELFAAVETVARTHPQHGERLAILTNGGGIGVMASDALISGGGVLAALSEDTVSPLGEVLPPTWSKANPVDIIGNAPGSRYADAMRILLASGDCDALLAMHAPLATADSMAAAQAVIDRAKGSKLNILSCWVGGHAVTLARRLFRETDIPAYDSSRPAVQAFMHLVNCRHSQMILMEAPPSAPREFERATETACRLVEARLSRDTDMMSEPEAKALLAAYGYPTVETRIVRSPEEAARYAAEIGFPVALKILSDDIIHKSDVGGVVLHLGSEAAVEDAARPGAHEVFVGMTSDPVFGPVIVFDQDGTAVEVVDDSAVALPPLNMILARDLIDRTRVAALLRGYRDRPGVDIDTLCLTLMQVSQLIVDRPEIAEIDINPLLVDADGVLALDARVRVAEPGLSRQLAIRPYPEALPEAVVLDSGRALTLWPIRLEDEAAHRAFLSQMAPDDIGSGFSCLSGICRTRRWRGSPRSISTAKWHSSPLTTWRKTPRRPSASFAPSPTRTTIAANSRSSSGRTSRVRGWERSCRGR